MGTERAESALRRGGLRCQREFSRLAVLSQEEGNDQYKHVQVSYCKYDTQVSNELTHGGLNLPGSAALAG